MAQLGNGLGRLGQNIYGTERGLENMAINLPATGEANWGETLNAALRALDARVDADRLSLSGTKRRQVVPIATKANPPADSSNNKSNGTHLGGTAKYVHKVTHSAYGVQLVYTNWVSGAANTEQDGWNEIIVGAAVEIGGTVMPVLFEGKRRVVVSPGGTVISDPIGVDVAKGADLATRTFVTVNAGEVYPLGNIPLASFGEGNNYGDPAGDDLTSTGSGNLTGVMTGGGYGFGPAAILGQVIDPDKPVIAIVGDSIANGTGESSAANGGYFQRALANNYSYQKVAFPGEALLSGWAQPNGINRRRRVGLLALCGVTHVLTNYTVNSLATATIQQDALSVWVSLARVGTEGVYAATLTPQTTSTDKWATVENQTVMLPGNETRRKEFNNWLRDGAPMSAEAQPLAAGTSGAIRAGSAGHPLAGFLEIADLAETSRGSGIWRADYTSDGTHPNSVGYAALAAGVDPLRLGQPSKA